MGDRGGVPWEPPLKLRACGGILGGAVAAPPRCHLGELALPAMPGDTTEKRRVPDCGVVGPVCGTSLTVACSLMGLPSARAAGLGCTAQFVAFSTCARDSAMARGTSRDECRRGTSAEAGAARLWTHRPSALPLAGVSSASPASDSPSSSSPGLPLRPRPVAGEVAATLAPADQAMRAERRTTDATQGDPMAAAVEGFTCTAAKRGTLPITREGVAPLRLSGPTVSPCAPSQGEAPSVLALPALKAEGACVKLCTGVCFWVLRGLLSAAEVSRGGLDGTSPSNVRCSATDTMRGGDGASRFNGAGLALMADDVMWGGDWGTSSSTGVQGPCTRSISTLASWLAVCSSALSQSSISWSAATATATAAGAAGGVAASGEAAAHKAPCKSRATACAGDVVPAVCAWLSSSGLGGRPFWGAAAGAASTGVGGAIPGKRGRASLQASRFFCTDDSTVGMAGMRRARAEMACDTLSYSHSLLRTAERPSISSSMARETSPAVSSSFEAYTQNRERARTSGTSEPSWLSTLRAPSKSPSADAARASFTFETSSNCMLFSRAEIGCATAAVPLLTGFDPARRLLAAETFLGRRF